MNQNNNFMQSQQQGRMLNVVLVPNINDADNYPINPGSSVLFLNEAMTEFRMRSRDPNGFPLLGRAWALKETTPPQQMGGQFATKAEMAELSEKMDKVLSTLNEFMK